MLLLLLMLFPSFVDDVNGVPDRGGVVNTNEAFCTVVQTRLADHKLLFSGEVDCRVNDPRAPPAPACYVELKTSAEICTPKQRSNFHRCASKLDLRFFFLLNSSLVLLTKGPKQYFLQLK